jgi:acyl-CoA reductase-like NAD-dependent aldehyde dehydrogenase
VHLSGGSSTHDAIVWGSDSGTSITQRDVPVSKAGMTSELGCVTPWIVAPQAWTDAQMNHQVKQFFAALYSNPGANCNSPKVVILAKTWQHNSQLVDKLCQEMKRNPLPVAYYPGSKERSTTFQQAYPDALGLGDDSTQANCQRGLTASATVLPWLLMDGVQVELTTDQGRNAARTEYAFRHESFAPVVTIAYADDLPAAVQLANDFLIGSLSCIIVAPVTTPDVEQAIADLKYGAIGVNVWSASCYLATGCTWGAFPGENIKAAESGIGQIHNCFFIPDIEKSVLRTPMVDASHPLRKSNAAATKEFTAIGNIVLQPVS